LPICFFIRQLREYKHQESLKVRVLRREKMKKLMIFIMVFGLTVFAANETGLSFNNSSAAGNVSVMTSPDIAIGIQSGDGSVCIVYLEITDAGRPGPAAASAGADIIQQLPDTTTLALLGLGGLLYRRRKE
jgi:hypothetical protein